MNFSETLKALRKQNHVTQRQLAEYLNISRPTIAGYETQNRQPDFESLYKLSRFFGVSIDYLLSGQESVTLNTENHGDTDESALDHEIMAVFQQLSLSSKRYALEYLKLLRIKDVTQN